MSQLKLYLLTPAFLIVGPQLLVQGSVLKGGCLLLFGVTFGFELARRHGVFDLNPRTHLALWVASLVSLLVLFVVMVVTDPGPR